VKVTGCTVHFVNDKMDAGRIIAQAVVPVQPKDDEASLSARILQEEHRLLPQVIGWIGEAVQMSLSMH
jgi:phosphoribosylglycinamide formyltransferase-1